MATELERHSRKHKETVNYHSTKMKKELVLQKLKEQGCRITKQRQMLLEVILNEECTCCKEIYYKAVKLEPGIGAATVYRMINLLEDIGAISRKNMYKISCCMECGKENACTIELDDNTVCHLSAQSWYSVISEGLKACGYVDNQRVNSVIVEPCQGEGC
jgi:Fur family transcriptional regulator, ferric uptake regulator